MTISDQTYHFYNQSTGYLERLEGASWRPEYGAVLGALKRYQLSRGGSALDYGCGVGDLTAILARTGYQAVGADISLPFVQSAQARHPHLPFVALGAGPMIPFARNQFWAVTAVNTIEHVATPAQTLRELHRVLAPGGLLVMTFPNLLSPLRPLKRFVARHKRARYGPESGDSAGQSLALLMRNVTSLLDSRLNQQARFRSRQPDFENAERYRLLGYGADYDAVWLCNPLDIVNHLRTLGMHVLDLRGIPGAAERSAAINHLRRALPASISSPILLAARKTY
ncbi:MAG TPA: class I SAM-dependent methyltransferase [Anaerolineae bacterium]|nr:class I SAM-dependent methyltransferase [Anaerolineae bacterium]